MKKIKVFLSMTCMTVTIAAAVASKANSKLDKVEYYISDNNTCESTPPVYCAEPGLGCTVIIPGQAGIKQVYDTRTTEGICQNPLKDY